MKRITFSLAIIFFFHFAVYPTVYTVSNQLNVKADFRDFNSAMVAASSGDTIVLMASPSGYGRLEINKSITVLGQSTQSEIYEKPVATSIYIDAPNVVLDGMECSYIYCSQAGEGAFLTSNRFKSISFFESCDNITLINNTFNILDTPLGVSNLMMVNNTMVDDTARNAQLVLNSVND